MFHRACDKYEQANPNLSRDTSFASTGSTPPASDTSSRNPVNKPFKRPSTVALGQRQLSDLNSMSSASSSEARTTVKRTSEGHVKTVGDMSRNGVPSQDSRGATASSNISLHVNALCGENDFDSDPELDVDESPARLPQAVSYPALPSKTSSTNRSAVTYPSLATAGIHTQAANSSLNQSQGNIGPPSSAPLPWSSSPLEPRQSTNQPNRFAKYSLEPDKTAEAEHSSMKPAAAPAKKRRTLPWLDSANQSDTRSDIDNDGPRRTLEVTPKRPVDAAYPWNTTASAIKEQQKELRKANKDASKQEAEKKEEGKVAGRASIAQLARKKAVARPHLSAEQRHVLDMVVENGQSVFFTGSAGTGKSVLLREIIAHLRKKFAKETDRVAITASTGLAACNVGGVTLHSFAGFGLGKEEVPELVKKIKRNQKAKHRWMRTKVLIVDEVSMVDADMFDKLEAIARSIRNNGRPFGGIQLVITGDFFQLPPVPESGRAAKFCFDAGTWASTIDHTIALHHVFRQKDPVFASMLNEMREGRLSQESINAFNSLKRPLGESAIEPTELFPTRSEVERANNAKMMQLRGGTKVFECRDGGTIADLAMRSKLLQNCMAPEKLELKIGSQVMLIKNIDETLVNGTLGHVVRFMTESMFDTYDEDEDEYDVVEKMDYDQLNPKQQKLKQQMMLLNNSQLLPLVRFRIADGTERELLCHRETWKIELPNGEVQAQRAQVPLILAWALSIHKAQGQTLERVKVDLGKVFEKGQAYVALSRAVSMNGLQVLRFDASKVMAHERVRTFYAGLSSAEQASKGSVIDVAPKRNAGRF